MKSPLQIYLVISGFILNISSSILSHSKNRESPKVKFNGVDVSNDDLIRYMTQQQFSPDSEYGSKSFESSSKSKPEYNNRHHREKRFIWITKEEKRIVLPPGTQLVLTPTLGKIYTLIRVKLTTRRN